MADTLNITGMERRIKQLQDSMERVEDGVRTNNQKLYELSEELRETCRELNLLQEKFMEYMDDSKKSATLQKAATELVRVRQEIQHNFGGYKIVRETMLGVLQATDLALVKKTTISQVTEELMLSTPDYWLAPCLVAIAAWIGNDRDLANRAITEALKRDEEKTALTMALICRRNNRTDTCYEWLSLYFSRQSASNFTESNFAYLNAYINGVFGPDKNHMCDDYVAKWMREIQENGSDVEKRQIDQWREYCSDFTVDLDSQFPSLNNHVHEYGDIRAYVNRIGSVEAISQNFSSMKNVTVDQQKLKKNIDSTLVELISRYDAKEEPLRKEERYLHAIRRFDGDTDAAKQLILEEDNARKENAIDLISQMTNIIVKKESVSPSEKKTAVSFLSSYIRNGFEDYITEKKEAFPKHVTVELEGWTGSTEFKNAQELKADYTQAMEEKHAEEVAALPVKRTKKLQIGAIALVVLSLICLAIHPVFTAACLIGAIVCFVYSKKFVGILNERRAQLDQSYAERIESGKREIDETLQEWDQARKMVNDFEAADLPDIVA